MAFSYFDENFTVIGNLCFVHIYVKGDLVDYDIPPAISDRMLFDDFDCIYLYYNKGRMISNPEPNTGFVKISYGKIRLYNAGTGYLSFFFPINSNK